MQSIQIRDICCQHTLVCNAYTKKTAGKRKQLKRVHLCLVEAADNAERALRFDGVVCRAGRSSVLAGHNAHVAILTLIEPSE